MMLKMMLFMLPILSIMLPIILFIILPIMLSIMLPIMLSIMHTLSMLRVLPMLYTLTCLIYNVYSAYVIHA